ncbi:putative DDE superfamily endonuclease [Lyophyllum shimeji]|uniref:DDE superfamily endonuclease n=1 Tax=Lyophyllum shimeji TaxID=47721 RepID=A0A9P3Q1M7_LYOSH|nr:putative DDE superfamily endonuclease [Lyophyllum shimeji]
MYSTRATSGSRPLIPPASVLTPPDSSFLHRRIPDSRLIVAPQVPHVTIQFLQGKGSLDLFSLDLPLPASCESASVQGSPLHTPPEIRTNEKFFPFFEDCLGAIDGSHIDAHVDASQAAAYRDRKGRLSTNILAACTFDLRFSYLLVGWEGSATDSRIFKDARENGFAVPRGKFYLADAGFPSCDTLLVPYRGVRYHLKEWGRAPEKYFMMSYF